MVQRSRLALEFPEPAGPASMLRGVPRLRLPPLRFDSARASALTVQPAIRFALTSVPPEQGRRLLSVFLPYSTIQPADSIRRFPGLRFVHLRGLSPPWRTFVIICQSFSSLFHPESALGLFPSGVSPSTTVREVTLASSPHAVSAKGGHLVHVRVA